MTQVASSPGVPTKIVEDAQTALADVKQVIAKVDTGAAAVVADVKADASKVLSSGSAVATDVSKAVSSIEFVKANWGKVSIAVIAAASIGAVVGHIL